MKKGLKVRFSLWIHGAVFLLVLAVSPWSSADQCSPKKIARDFISITLAGLHLPQYHPPHGCPKPQAKFDAEAFSSGEIDISAPPTIVPDRTTVKILKTKKSHEDPNYITVVFSLRTSESQEFRDQVEFVLNEKEKVKEHGCATLMVSPSKFYLRASCFERTYFAAKSKKKITRKNASE